MTNILTRSLSLVATAVACFLATSTVVQAQYDELILEAEPFAYWRLNDEIPDDGPEDTGLGDGIISTYENVELLVDSLVPGDDDKAARFNGLNSLIRVPDDAQTNTGGPYAEKTVEFWFSADDALTDTPQVIFEAGGTTRGITMYVHEGDIVMGAWNRNNDDNGVSSPWMNPDPGISHDDQSVYFRRSIESNVAYHAALVMAGDDAGFEGTLTGYLDGAPFGTGTGVGQLFNHGDDVGIGGMDTNTLLVDGSNPGGDGLFFAGVIDELALYNIALDQETIMAHALIEPRDPPGDFNDDGEMNLADFEILLANFGLRFGRDDAINHGDFNRDQFVDLADFRDFRAAFNAPAGAAAVPEPHSILLLCMAAMSAGLLRRRHAR